MRVDYFISSFICSDSILLMKQPCFQSVFLPLALIWLLEDALRSCLWTWLHYASSWQAAPRHQNQAQTPRWWETSLCPFKKQKVKTQNQGWEPPANGLRGVIKNYFRPAFLHGLTKLMFTHLQLSKRIMCLMKEKSTDSHIYCPSLALVLNLI